MRLVPKQTKSSPSIISTLVNINIKIYFNPDSFLATYRLVVLRHIRTMPLNG